MKEKSRKQLAQEMKDASYAVRKESLQTAREWDFSLEDGVRADDDDESQS